MRVAIVGAGAVGTFVGGLLALAGGDVTLVRRPGPAVEARPVGLTGPDGRRREAALRLVRRTSDAPPPDLIVVAVKMFALREAVATTLEWPAVPVLTVQNGVGAEEIVAELRDAAPIVAGSLTAPIELAAADDVRWLGRGGIALAATGPAAGEAAGWLVSSFGQAGLPAVRMADPVAMKWSKLLANLVANATSAILDLDPAAIYRDPRLFAVERRQALETLAVMRRLGRRPVHLPGAQVPLLALAFRLPPALGRPALARIVGGARGGKDPSLRLAVRTAATHTEAAWLNGGVARQAEELGTTAPVNARLAELVDEVARDARRRTWFRGHPERLLATLEEAGWAR